MFADLRLFPKYLLSHGVVALFTALVIAALSFAVAKDEMKVYARASAQAILEQTGRLLEKKDSELQKNLVAQLDQAGIYRLLREGVSRGDPVARLRLERQLAGMMSRNRWMLSILLRPLSGPEVFLPAYDAAAEAGAIGAFDPAAVGELHGRAYWYSGEGGKIFFCKMVYDLETTANLGFMAIGIDPAFFDNLSPIERYRGLGSLFFVSLDSGQLIFHTEAPSEVVDRVVALAALREAPPPQFGGGGSVFLASAQISDSKSWEVLNVASLGELTALSARTGVLILEATLAILALALALAFVLVRSEVGKITALVAQTHLIAGGDFRQSAGVRGRDELGELGTEISSMAREIGELVDKVASEKNQKTEAELRALHFEYSALQSSLNPHFISNTLELINSAAKLRGAPEIGEVACLLGDLMRASFRRKENLLPLEEELEHCRIYLRIQELLAESRLDVVYEIPQGLGSRKVPNLILQPIVENAILHGIEPKIGSATLRIAAREAEGILELSVSDDGVGIAPARLPELLAPRDEPARRKIGLESVDKRIKILFGPAFGLRIHSVLGEGTEVTIRMPAVEGEAG